MIDLIVVLIMFAILFLVTICIILKHKPFTHNNISECDHIYFPVLVDGKPAGQRCSICGKFNSLKDLGLE